MSISMFTRAGVLERTGIVASHRKERTAGRTASLNCEEGDLLEEQGETLDSI